MPSINMIAGRRADKIRRENNLKNTVYAILVETGVVVLALGVLTIRVGAIHAQVAEFDGKIQSLQPKVNQIQKLQQETARLMPKVQTLDGAKQDTLFWYNSIFAVANSLPPKTWLTSLSTTGAAPADANTVPGQVSGKDPTILVSGIATTHATVGDAMLRMNQATQLDHVDLAFDQSQKVGKEDTVAFQMTIHLKPEAAPDGKGGADVKKS
jgi:Tfp pilus assembly protein PilN